jgi:NADPH2:quinone reductase
VLNVGEVERPKPSAGEVLVRLATSGVNPSDVKSRLGRPLAFPKIVPHSDGAGVIEAVGDGVDAVRIGERVWLWNGQWKRPSGTAAEYIALPERQAVPLADDSDFADAACFGIPAQTAWHAVASCGEINGKTLLVTGAASGVGHYVVQIARRKGARVIGTASERRRDHAMAAGCEAVIDYRKEPVVERLRALNGGEGADAVIDMDLSSTAPLLPQGLLRPHGIHVCYGSNVPGDVPISYPTMLWSSLTLKVFVVYDLTAMERERALHGLKQLLDERALSHTIGARFPLADIAKAHEAVEKGDLIGNVIIDCG